MLPSRACRLSLAYALLCVCWIFTDPPFSAPDEWSHYLRALGLAQGQVVGEPIPSFRDPALERRQEAWVAQTARWTEVRPGMAPEGYGCNAFHPEASAACLYRAPKPPREAVRIATVNGTYQPAGYLLPALALRSASDPVSGILRARLANALLSLALIVASALALSPNLVGLASAVTPMVLFLASTLNPSGLEIAGGVAFAAGLLGLSRGDRPAAAWGATGAGGAVLCLSRSLGPGWLMTIAGVWLVWLGPAQAWRLARGSPRQAVSSTVLVTLAAAANRVWEARYAPTLPPRTEPLGLALRESIVRVPGWIREQIGIFQYLDAPMPRFAYVLWGAVVLLLVLCAAWLGTSRDRVALGLACGAAIAIPVLLHAIAMRPIGWVVQGRHVLPLGVLVPMLSAEIVTVRARTVPAWAATAAAVPISVVHLVALCSNGRRSAVGMQGSWFFPLRPEWNPMLGWWPWLLLALAACGLLCTVWACPRPRQGIRPGGGARPEPG